MKEVVDMENIRILIVEDESIVAMDIKLMLQNAGYHVVATVDSGEKAVEKAGIFSPDLVLMDIHLKGKMDGIEASEIIRNQFFLPVIFLTAFADEETLKRARASEAFGYIMKPFEEQSLKPAIEMALYKHKLERALRASEVRYRSLVDTLPDAVFVTDLELKIQFCNNQAVKMYQCTSQQDLIGKSALDLLASENHDRLAACVREIRETGESGMAEFSLHRNNGVPFPGEINATVVMDEFGNPKGYIAISRDISDRKHLEKQTHDLLEQVQNLARRDSLTNLYNHRYFYEIAEAEFSRSKRYNRPLAAIMIDLDHFKRINDQFGHQVGDQTLQVVANLLHSNLREIDILGRIGGEEFLAMLPEAEPVEAKNIAQRLCDCIGQHSISIGAQSIHITASFGIASISDNAFDLKMLINWADKAQYKAKHNGRNRVEVWDDRDANQGSYPNLSAEVGV
jgi:diguanylate cyclase (GGDEF)-like protein/PAS domain S-box-containing protein